MLTLEQGARLIALARKSIFSKFSLLGLRIKSSDKADFAALRPGAVALYNHGKMRGSCQLLEETAPLFQAVSTCAFMAAFRDPRFVAVGKKELPELIIEVSVLSRPKRLDVRNPEEYLQKIPKGAGVEARGTFHKGSVLPYEAMAAQWDPATMLAQACIRANLDPDDWLNFDKSRVYIFTSQVFSETSSEGQVIQIM